MKSDVRSSNLFQLTIEFSKPKDFIRLKLALMDEENR